MRQVSSNTEACFLPRVITRSTSSPACLSQEYSRNKIAIRQTVMEVAAYVLRTLYGVLVWWGHRNPPALPTSRCLLPADHPPATQRKATSQIICRPRGGGHAQRITYPDVTRVRYKPFTIIQGDGTAPAGLSTCQPPGEPQ